MSAALTLHGYWRSGTSYRTRIALNIKGLTYDQVTHDLRTGEQSGDAFKALNPQGLVPALEVGDKVLIQSPAILEWLEEAYPDPPLLPSDPDDRAVARAMAMLVACDVHPINNVRILKYLKHNLGADQNAIDGWAAHWIHAGFAALEQMIATHGGRYAYGDSLTMADCNLVPQFYSAERFGVDTGAYPHIERVVAAAREDKAVAAAHPDLQPDAPATA